MRYTKKPVTIEAVQFMGLNADGDPLFAFKGEMPEWLGEAISGPEEGAGSIWVRHKPEGGVAYLCIGTLEGPHIANHGDWIIQGIKGELYPCKPDIFEATYSAAIAPELEKAMADSKRSLLLDMQQESIELRMALHAAEEQFADYALQHERKADRFEREGFMLEAAESRRKAERNRQLVAICRAAIDFKMQPDCPILVAIHDDGLDALRSRDTVADSDGNDGA